jgi:Tol biopolymer transport system component
MRNLATAGVALLWLSWDEPASIHTIAQRDPWWKPTEGAAAAVSADGRFVAFASYARLVPADTNNRRDVYVLDRDDGRVTLESVMPDGEPSRVDSTQPGISADGRFLVYLTSLRSLPPLSASVIALHDRRDGRFTILGPPGGVADGTCADPVISDDGRVVAFTSAATNLVPGADVNGAGMDIYAFEVASSTFSRVSVDSRGVQPASGSSMAPSISADGRYVAFASTAPLGGPARRARSGRARPDVYVRDRLRGVTANVGGLLRRQPDGASWGAAISGDGRHVAFVTDADNLTDGDRNRSADVFVVDLKTGMADLVSRRAGGGVANGPSGSPDVSADGRFVAFQSVASNILCARRCSPSSEDINLLSDVFVFDRERGVVTRASGDADGGWIEPSGGAAIDATGDLVVFASRHPIDAADTTNDFDLFLVLRRAVRSGTLPPSARAPEPHRPSPSAPCLFPWRCSA